MASAVLILVIIVAFFGIIQLAKAARSLPRDIATKTSARKLANSEAEERLYDLVRREYESGDIRRGLWTKAEATALSTEEAAIRAKYFQLRFEQLQAHESLPQQESQKAETAKPQKAENSKRQIVAQRISTVEIPIEVEEKGSDSPTDRRSPKAYILIGVWLVFVFFLGYSVFEFWRHWSKQFLEEASNPEVGTELVGIELGMTISDVRRLKGRPYMGGESDISWNDDWGGYFVFLYFEENWGATYPDNRGVSVTFVGETPNELVAKQICSWQPFISVDGYGYFVDEEDATERLGDPDRTVFSEDGLRKTIYYWEANLEFTFEKGEMIWGCVGGNF